jgi:hypothetical protein
VGQHGRAGSCRCADARMGQLRPDASTWPPFTCRYRSSSSPGCSSRTRSTWGREIVPRDGDTAAVANLRCCRPRRACLPLPQRGHETAPQASSRTRRSGRPRPGRNPRETSTACAAPRSACGPARSSGAPRHSCWAGPVQPPSPALHSPCLCPCPHLLGCQLLGPYGRQQLVQAGDVGLRQAYGPVFPAEGGLKGLRDPVPNHHRHAASKESLPGQGPGRAHHFNAGLAATRAAVSTAPRCASRWARSLRPRPA